MSGSEFMSRLCSICPEALKSSGSKDLLGFVNPKPLNRKRFPGA